MRNFLSSDAGLRAPAAVRVKAAALAVVLALSLIRSGRAETITVTTTADSGAGSFRQAILTANANPGLDTIVFQISGTAPFSISPGSALPAITDPVVIDATTQPGYAGKPVVELNGTSAGSGTIGLRFVSGGSTLQGLAINRFSVQAIELDGGTNVIQGNFVGTDPTGMIQRDNGSMALLVKSAGNLIGGANSGNGNLLSAGDSANSAGIYFLYASNNVVQGNLIGLNAAGTAGFASINDGIILYGSSSNLVETNIISGNGQSGIYLTGAGATGNLIQGNRIGTDASGNNAVGNAKGDGITLAGAPGNIICSNLISGNGLAGVSIEAAGANNNQIFGNLIGTDAGGQNALPNTNFGVSVSGGSGNQIGGVSPGAANVISGNVLAGIYLTGGAGTNWIQGNWIGIAASGKASLGNGATTNGASAGIAISASSANLIGGTTSGAGNVISGNTGAGILLLGPGTSNNVIQGNLIGTDPSGMLAVGNVWEGIYIQGAFTNRIGGSAAGAGNVISGNDAQGIFLTNSTWNVILGNWIGVKADGASNLGNKLHNVELQAGANNNLVGGTAAGAGNTLAYAQSVYCGVRVRTAAANNLISGNSIFNNGGLGIDLSPTDGGTAAGVNPIVTCESGVAADAANGGQNFPTVSNVYSSTITRVRGNLNSKTGRTYSLEFFASPAGDASGYGEGQRYLGQTNLTLGASCSSNFTAYLSTPVPAGWVVTATATDPIRNTSEFSAWVPVIPMPQVQLSSGGGSLGGASQISIAWTNNGGSFALEQATNLTPPAVWVPVTNAPVAAGNSSVISVAPSQGSVFYRLVAP